MFLTSECSERTLSLQLKSFVKKKIQLFKIFMSVRVVKFNETVEVIILAIVNHFAHVAVQGFCDYWHVASTAFILIHPTGLESLLHSGNPL